MKIKDLYSSGKTIFSFEIFPPKPDFSLDSIYKTIEELEHLNPSFISVTYGAGGGTRSRTVEISSKIKNFYNIEALSHLSCISSTSVDIDEILLELKTNNIKNILALRGDLPQQPPEQVSTGQYKYACDLVCYLNKFSDFCIGAACYPESHFESQSKEADIENLKYKVNCGVDFLITQLFFDNDSFYSFIENIRKSGINCPVSAGIMPVYNIKIIERITSMSMAKIPRKLKDILVKHGENPSDLLKAGIEYAVNQIKDLMSHGVDGIHLYTMNKSEQTKEIAKEVMR